ncbi:YczE/YyaS/YitT family protein [Robertmurraya korlensis]|uniref:YczE/YyaS/YitT family protein n=1 Tax=Robertmurraya korlensis TaxID=519977 RepID=UPI000824449D|nr:YitT family protein [Robertmurraya korlensis]
MGIKKTGQVGPRFFIYFLGLLLMSLGIVFLIKADIGATPWDVLHVGLHYQFGLTIGTWSILVGVAILTLASIISKEFPQIGAFLNMLLVGVFIDMYFLLPIIQTPGDWIGKSLMFVAGLLLNGYGMGLYISASFGAGPRDSLMIALTASTGWKLTYVRACIEIIVLIIGWQLGGPVFIGTVVFSFVIGPIVGIALPQCKILTDYFLKKLHSTDRMAEHTKEDISNRGASL